VPLVSLAEHERTEKLDSHREFIIGALLIASGGEREGAPRDLDRLELRGSNRRRAFASARRQSGGGAELVRRAIFLCAGGRR